MKRYGLDVLWDDRDNLKFLIIAGRTFTLEVGMKDHRVETVELQYAYSGPDVKKHAVQAGAILLQNLKLAPDQHPWTKQLDDFASNLESLAILDKLSVVDDNGAAVLITYDAIAALVESLQKVHDWDVARLREDPAYSQKPDEQLHTIAMCERNGRPFAHERGIVGMGLEYWRSQRYHTPSPAKAEKWYKEAKHWSILVGCARRDPLVYPAAVRVSNKWIGEEIETTTEGLPPMLDWQEPPAVVLPDKPVDDLLLPGPKYPEVMFMAVFDPPVTLPLSEWEQIHHYTGAPVAHPAYMQTYDYLAFPPADGNYNPAEPRVVASKRTIRTQMRDATFENVEHENRLFVHKPVYGQALTELPFSHPSQLVNMLPTLRQYAFLYNLLDKAFGSQAEKYATPNLAPPTADPNSITVTTRSSEFDIFMGDATADQGDHPANSNERSAVKVDVTLNVHPQPSPKLQVMFPFRGRPAQVTVDVGRNGVVTIESTNVVDEEGRVLDEHGAPLEGARAEPAYARERLARLLMFFEDIDKWCEWIRNHVGPA